MFGYTVFLKIGNLAASSLTDMYKDSYQLIGCEFGFAQGIDIKGQAQTEVKGGTFYVTYPHLPNRDMIQSLISMIHSSISSKSGSTHLHGTFREVSTRLTHLGFIN